jgi:putative zinc finger/helix-turn-helix YgiT family protein
MPPQKQREPKERPFPWRCSDCFTQTVVPTVIDYVAKVKQDGVLHELHLPGIEVPRCQTCGGLTITSAVDERVNDALRLRLRLLTPAQMREGIKKLGLKQQELAEKLGVAPETISRWVNGALIQSRAMDNFLRVYFAVPEVRAVLQGTGQDPNLGTTDTGGPDRAGSDPPAPGVNRIRGQFPHLPDADKASHLARAFQVVPGVN